MKPRSPKEIAEEIFQVGGEEHTSFEDAAVYLIRFEDHAALVDAGTGRYTAALLDQIRKCSVDPKGIQYILLTHCHFDHTGGVNALKKLSGCRVIAHALDAQYLEQGDNRITAAGWYGADLEPFRVERKLTGFQEDILLGQRVVTAYHTPGHSPGSVVYVTESGGQKVLFGQDVHGPLDESLRSNREDYIRSLQFLLSLDVDILCEGHYGVFRGKDRIRRFIRSFLDA